MEVSGSTRFGIPSILRFFPAVPPLEWMGLSSKLRLLWPESDKEEEEVLGMMFLCFAEESRSDDDVVERLVFLEEDESTAPSASCEDKSLTLLGEE